MLHTRTGSRLFLMAYLCKKLTRRTLLFLFFSSFFDILSRIILLDDLDFLGLRSVFLLGGLFLISLALLDHLFNPGGKGLAEADFFASFEFCVGVFDDAVEEESTAIEEGGPATETLAEAVTEIKAYIHSEIEALKKRIEQLDRGQ